MRLGSDEGVILVQGGAGEAWDQSTLLAVQQNEELSSDGNDVWVLTADQWGPFEVKVRVLDGPPSEPADDWEDVAEVSLRLTTGLYVSELVSQDIGMALDCEPGTYRIRVSARGRSAGDADEDADGEPTEPSSDEVVELYLIEAWQAPTLPPHDVRESSSYSRATREGPAPEPFVAEAAAGLAASARIGRDVDAAPGARSLTGQFGAIAATGTIPGTRRSLFRWFKFPLPLSRHVPSWSSMSVGPDWDKIGGINYGQAAEGHPDQLSGRRGLLRNIVIEEQPPARRVRTWAWLVPPDGQSGGHPDHRRPVFQPDSTIFTTFSQSRDVEGRPWTTIEIHHEGLPVEWLDDMRTWWGYQLALLKSQAERT